MLKFSKANAKTQRLYKIANLRPYLQNKRKIYSLDLLSGHYCPFAEKCLSRAVSTNEGMRIKDGPKTEFRCFSASQEVLYPHTYKNRKHNSDTLRGQQSLSGMYDVISQSIPSNTGIIRIHVSGDFFNQNYFDAWLRIAKNNPNILFYAYTKSLPYWIKRIDSIPNNLVLTASQGGKRDDLIESFNLRNAIVVYSGYEARKLGLKIDHNDSLATNKSIHQFALLIHGVQPKNTKAGKAWNKMKHTSGYNRKAI